MIRITHITLILGLFLAAITASAQAQMYKGYQTPAYTVVRQMGAVELRDYASHVVAEVSVRGSRDSAIGRGFRELAGYIFGGNATGEKIAMTTPVTQFPQDEPGVWTTRFMMPEGYDLERLPEAESPSVRFVKTEPVRHIVLQFSGRWQDRNLTEFEEELRAQAEMAGLSIEGPAIYHFYDGPMTLPWNRRNEVAFAVR